MSETKQTRCPHCSSVFKISDEQLAARGGHVRCGGCLQVFRADQYIVTGDILPQPSDSPSTQAAPSSMPIMAHEQYAAPKSQESKPAKKRNKDDESWAKNLLGDDIDDLEDDSPALPIKKPVIPVETAPPPQKSKKPLFDDEISDLLHEAWSAPAEKAHLKGLGEVDKIKANADESWAQALISELEEEEKKEKEKNYSMELAPQKPKEAPSKKPNTDNKPSVVEAPVATPAKEATQEDDLLNFLNNNTSVNMAAVRSQTAQIPLEISSQPMISINWSYWLTWGVMCSFAAVLLLVQYVYFNFNDLALNDKTRPQISQLCQSLGCQLPEPPNALLIDIKKLVIRKHPSVPNALQVNAMVFNKAEFAQPLPALKLSFLSKNRSVTAARIFQPSEYLQGDIGKNLKRIPPETPIQIQLDIINPNVDITSYKMKPLFK